MRRGLAVLCGLLSLAGAAQAQWGDPTPQRGGRYGFSDGNAIGKLNLEAVPGKDHYDFTLTMAVTQPKPKHGEYKGTIRVINDRATWHSRELGDCVLKFQFSGEKIFVSGDTPKTCTKADGFTFSHPYRRKYRD